MAQKKVSKETTNQRKVNNGDAINKRIIENGRAINKEKSSSKGKK